MYLNILLNNDDFLMVNNFVNKFHKSLFVNFSVH